MQGGEVRNRVIQGLDKEIDEGRDLGERAIQPAKDLVDKEVNKLDQKKQEIEKKQQELGRKQQELHDEKEKLDELMEKKVEEPVKEVKRLFEQKPKEKISPENLINKLGYNLESQHVNNNPPESVKELMAAKHKVHSAIDNQLNKAGIAVEDKANEIGDRIGVTRIATEEGAEHQA
jgi:exonuclease VII large subunit